MQLLFLIFYTELIYILYLVKFIYHNSLFGNGYGPIIYSNVHCVGDEDRFTFCPKNNYFSTTCDHSDVIGILCKDGK